MKKMIDTEKFTDSDWEKLAAEMSDGEKDKSDFLASFQAGDGLNTSGNWDNIRNSTDKVTVDVDNAWSSVSAKIKNTEGEKEKVTGRVFRLSGRMIRIAAGIAILTGILTLALFQTGVFQGKTSFVTTADQKNLVVDLPDGSRVTLNRNTTLSYRNNFGEKGRNVTLTGEAFFEVATDQEKPFIIDAGKARVRVVGTSFNVITSNSYSAVEVFVKTGRVMLSDKEGTQNIMLDPGFVGTYDSEIPEKKLNSDPNYMAWNTGQLKYDGQKLEVVFSDLKRVFNASIQTDDPEILNLPLTSPPINNEPIDTIIQIICTSFNLSFTKDGAVYRLERK